MDDIESMTMDDKRHYMMNTFREDYPVVLNLLGKMSVSTHLMMEKQELVAVVKALSIACIEYERYVEEFETDMTGLH